MPDLTSARSCELGSLLCKFKDTRSKVFSSKADSNQSNTNPRHYFGKFWKLLSICPVQYLISLILIRVVLSGLRRTLLFSNLSRTRIEPGPSVSRFEICWRPSAKVRSSRVTAASDGTGNFFFFDANDLSIIRPTSPIFFWTVARDRCIFCLLSSESIFHLYAGNNQRLHLSRALISCYTIVARR